MEHQLVLAVAQLMGEFLALMGMLAIFNAIQERREFRKYEQRRRKYSEWRLNHLDRI